MPSPDIIYDDAKADAEGSAFNAKAGPILHEIQIYLKLINEARAKLRELGLQLFYLPYLDNKTGRQKLGVSISLAPPSDG